MNTRCKNASRILAAGLLIRVAQVMFSAAGAGAAVTAAATTALRPLFISAEMQGKRKKYKDKKKQTNDDQKLHIHLIVEHRHQKLLC